MARNDARTMVGPRGARRTASPSTYRCPLCGQQLPALSEHMLLFPEGDHSRRRHAHTACVMRARQDGGCRPAMSGRGRPMPAARWPPAHLTPGRRTLVDRLLRRRQPQ